MKNNKNGFTLVELLAVITILGVIMVVAAPMALDSFYKARNQLGEMEKGVLLDAGKTYLTDLDKGKLKYVLTEDTMVNGHTYKKGDKMGGYDLRCYIIDHSGITVDIKTLVEGGYYDKVCNYDKDGNPSDGCKIKGECVLKVKLEHKLVDENGVTYKVTTGYDSEIYKGCEE